MNNILERHRKIWREKKILRTIYSEWYQKIISDLKMGGGKTIELGAGSGNFKEFKSDVIASDIDASCKWLDMCFDAHEMPFEDGSISNIVMIDVFHHLSDPIRFLHECERVLEKSGRVIMLEPFPSLFSSIVYRFFHPEPFLMKVDYFGRFGADFKKDPWDSNQAIPYLIFFKHFRKWEDIFGKNFHILKKQKLSFLLYPLSGGFENKSLIPEFLVPTMSVVEKWLNPLRSLLAFRCYIVLERK